MDGTAQTAPSLDRIVSIVGELPASPAIVSSVVSMTSDHDTNVEQLGKVLSSDQALTAKVLKLSNSSFYGRSKAVATLKEAILILGFHTLRSLVIATSTHSLYKKKVGNVLEQKLWEHSLATAMACRLVGRKIRHARTEEAFVTGLLHDIGKLILSQNLSDAYEAICEKVEREHVTFLETEVEKLGFSHTDIARTLFAKWNFPSSLITAVCLHHNPQAESDFELSGGDIGNIPTAFIVNFCNQLAKHVNCGFDDYKEEDLSALALAQAARFEPDDIDELIEKLRDAYESERHMFEN